MRAAHLLQLLFLLVSLFFSSGRVSRSSGQQPVAQQWTHGFWFWDGSSTSAATEVGPVDVLFFQAGTIQKDGRALDTRYQFTYSRADQLPQAKEYWMVYRYEGRDVPNERVARELANVVGDSVASELRRGRRIAGIQLDIDSPTNLLPTYAKFLNAVRRELPNDLQLSITALLDWFRPGTAVASVIREVDEFVPQFYDIGEYERGRIAARFDGARWGQMLSRYKKRFRIGISTFGRARNITEDGYREHLRQYSVLADVKPFELAVNSGFQARATSTDAKEVLLNFRAIRRVQIGFSTIEPGQAIEFTLATPEGVRYAVEQAKLTGPYCAGVVFFRWPSFDETIAMQPNEILEAVGAIPVRASTPHVRAVNGNCAAVSCVDLFVLGLERVAAATVRYRIESTEPLEYFIPKEKMPARMSGPSQMELKIPAYSCRSHLLLGRVVTRKPAEFSIQEAP